jgi:glutamyl-tRNA reductase
MNSQNGNGDPAGNPKTGPEMAEIVLIGVNHKTAPVELREKLALSGDETQNALNLFQKTPSVNEVMILSTCNRVEVLMVTDNRSQAVETILSFITATKTIPPAQLKKCT